MVQFPDEKRNQVSPGFRSSERRIDILALANAALNKSELRTASENFLDLADLDLMLPL